MKRLLLLLGPVFALLGSLGLVMFGSALVGVFDVLTFGIVDPPNPPPAVLAELEWAVMSAMALVAGLVVSCIATVMRDSGQTISTAGRLLYSGAGVSLMVGTIPLAWGIVSAKGSFQIIATSASIPTAESIQQMIQSTETPMAIGYAMLALSAVLLLLAGLMGLQTRASQANNPSPLRAVVAAGAALVGAVSFLLLISIWFNGNALRVMVTDTALPEPAALAAHLVAMLNKSLLVFGLWGVLGLLQLLASLFSPLSHGPEETTQLSGEAAMDKSPSKMPSVMMNVATVSTIHLSLGIVS